MWFPFTVEGSRLGCLRIRCTGRRNCYLFSVHIHFSISYRTKCNVNGKGSCWIPISNAHFLLYQSLLSCCNFLCKCGYSFTMHLLSL